MFKILYHSAWILNLDSVQMSLNHAIKQRQTFCETANLKLWKKILRKMSPLGMSTICFGINDKFFMWKKIGLVKKKLTKENEFFVLVIKEVNLFSSFCRKCATWRMDRSSRNGFNCIGKLTPLPFPPPFQNQSVSDLQRVHIHAVRQYT